MDTGGSRKNKGLISIYTSPILAQDRSTHKGAYVTSCQDLDGIDVLFLNIPQELQPFFDKRIENQYPMCTPCVVGECVDEEHSYHNATLLVPPGINRDSKLFRNGLVIPNMKIVGTVWKGYLMESEHLGPQRLFVPALRSFETLKELDPDAWSKIRFQGIIYDAHKGEKRKRPFHPFIYTRENSITDKEILDENAKRMEGLKEAMAKHEVKFWWEWEYDIPELDQPEL